MASYMFVAVILIIVALLCPSFGGKPNTGDCNFGKYHEDHELGNVDKIKGLIGKSFTTDNLKDGYRYTVGICANLEIDDASSDAGALQQKLKEDGTADPKEKKHNIGSLKNTHLMAGKDWALLEYRDGDEYTSSVHCKKASRRTLIMLTCDDSIDDGDAKMINIEEESNKDEGCYYLFEMKHKALCPTVSGGVLSVGSILVITFFTVVALYLLFGFLYQRFILGSKGIEQIPNYEFWKDFGNLEADGCDFIFRTRSRQNTGFRGIGDDQLDPMDEVRDDNLLPM